MLRPSHMTGSNRSKGKKGGSSVLSHNPIVAWFAKRKDARAKAKEEADRAITANKADNEAKIKAKLSSINFSTTPLPLEVMDEKSNPNQPYGDIEFQILGAIDLISNNTQDYGTLNISRIDNGIYQIAILTKQAIDGGHANAARAACHALTVTIGKIRDQIPSVPANLQKDFIEKSEAYIERWLDYIQNSTVLDGLQDSVTSREQAVQEKTRSMNQERDNMAERLINDPALKDKMERIFHEKYIIHGSTWDEDMKALYKWMVDMRLRESSLQYEMLCYNKDYQDLMRHKHILDTFLTTLRTIPQPQDKDLLNKYNELIQKTEKEAVEQDQQFDEIFQEMDRMDAKIEQIANAPGNIRARDEAQKQIEKVVELARKKQLEAHGVMENKQGGSQIHLYTEEEIAQIASQHERVMEPQVITNTNQQNQVNTNRPRNTN